MNLLNLLNKRDLIINYLDSLFNDSKIELNYSNAYELLVAVILSAQTTDKQVNKVTKNLFLKYPNFNSLKDANINELEESIKSIGLYKSKAKNIINMANKIVNSFNGEIPNNLNDLIKLDGVGRKTANVILSNVFNVPAFAVDTHVFRVSKRLKIADDKDSFIEVEKKLMSFFEKNTWQKLHHQIILFGRYHCKAVNPNCNNCNLINICIMGDK